MEAASTPGQAPQHLKAARLGASSLRPACLRQGVLVTHRGKAPPPLQAEAEHSSGCQVVSFLLPHNPRDIPAHSTGGVLSPGGHQPSSGE